MKKLLTILCAALLASLMLASVSVSAAEYEFVDVEEWTWYYEYVMEACELGLMQGKGDGVFAPNENLTRAQFITILWRLSGDPEDPENAFTDVPSDIWYAPYVGWAVKNGVVSGYEDNTFRGDNPVSRQELMVMTVRYLDSRWLDLGAVKDYTVWDISDDFANDKENVASWAMYHTLKMVGSGLITGDTERNINPTKTATRAEVSTIMVRLVKAIEPLREGFTVRGNPLSDMAVYSDELSYEQLVAASNAIKTATNHDLLANASECMVIFNVDENLRQLEYSVQVWNYNLVFSVSTQYAFDYFPQIIEDAMGGKTGWALGNGFYTNGTYTLDNARDLDYNSLHYLCETDKNPLAYNLGEEATFRVSFLSGSKLVAAPQFKYVYETEDGKKTEKTVPGHSGQLVLTFKGMNIPGVGKLTVYPANKKGVAIAEMRTMTGSIVYDFYNLKTFETIPSDFNEFWADKMTQLDAVALEPEKFEVCPVYGRDGYTVYCAVIPTQKDPAHAHISVPNGAAPGTLKIYGRFDGYGQPGSDGPDYHGDGITVSVNSHSISNHATSEEYAAYTEAIAGLAFDDPEYLVHMLCRDVQAMKFAVKEFADLWNGKDIITAGGSMGGFQAIGVAALYDKVTECSPSIAWMCDIGGSTKGDRHHGWRPAYNDVSKYVDSTYLATMFDGKVSMDGGLGDYTCPPSGLVCLYNAFPGTDKSIYFTQTRDHGYGGGVYNKSYSLSTRNPELDNTVTVIIDNGYAVPAPDYNPDRELSDSELELKAIADEMRKGEKFLSASYATSTDIIASEIETTLYNILTEKYGLDKSCRVELDIDAFAAFKEGFQNISAGGLHISSIEYTIYDSNGGYYDAKVSTRFTKE